MNRTEIVIRASGDDARRLRELLHDIRGSLQVGLARYGLDARQQARLKLVTRLLHEMGDE